MSLSGEMFRNLFTDSFHVAFWNLILGGFGICCLLMINNSNTLHSNETVNALLTSSDAKYAGIALLVSSIPLLIDIFVTLLNKNLFKMGDEILIGRIYYAISTFLFGLQLTLQCDIFQFFSNYETSFWIVLWCYRIVLASSLNFFICMTDPNNKSCNHTIFFIFIIWFVIFSSTKTKENIIFAYHVYLSTLHHCHHSVLCSVIRQF